ncbi:right-handed parallel beta-helix repeat-containing protein [Listeria fleischmannii]|uniref:Right-handed parallel beta-helix repeat-containing protein n=1 Tax=Listeria fleischmannii TaxID=1069827 RepID=A0A841YFJ3_9LIST|nr:right-handed parallel beta-helix repeat-containing protein [Listeria fleischmannii]EIA19661.1 hypothetical protein KKC_11226 [Listeria fleischmannii subsp. coloradonensis]MBC1399212.1 right-handed parallel beta-helix repeat-containing protein [Listeria fleischmannii]MBC1427636.1 right-handed parallel beta-helix repeat-containing protein [Listeria fleischmannii]STY34863.1 Uncharacterised protein [Listeria fleischmannii subsp. coloradonensis]
MTEHILTDTLTTLDQLQTGTYLKARDYDTPSGDIGWLPAMVEIIAPRDAQGHYQSPPPMTLENLVFDLNGSSHSGLRLIGCQHIIIRNCIFKGYQFNSNKVPKENKNESAIYFQDCQHVTVEHCHFVNLDPGEPMDDNGTAPEYFPHQLNRCISIEGFESRDFTIQHNHFGRSTAAKPPMMTVEDWAQDQRQPIVQGITCVGYALTEETFRIQHNTFCQAKDNALYLTACQGATITDNTFEAIEEAIVLYGAENTADATQATGSFTIQQNRFYNIANTILGISGDLTHGKQFRHTKKVAFLDNVIDQKYQRDAALAGEPGTPLFFRSVQDNGGVPQVYQVNELTLCGNRFTSLNRNFHIFHLGNVETLCVENNVLQGDFKTDYGRAVFYCRTNQPFGPKSIIRNNWIQKKKDRYAAQPMTAFALNYDVIKPETGAPETLLHTLRPANTFATYYPLHEGDTTFQWNERERVGARSLYLGNQSVTPRHVSGERYRADFPAPLQAGQTVHYFSTCPLIEGAPPFYVEDTHRTVYPRGLVVEPYTLGEDWVVGRWVGQTPIESLRVVIDGQPTIEVRPQSDPNGAYDFRYFLKNQVTPETEYVLLQAFGKKTQPETEAPLLDEVHLPLLQKGWLTSPVYHPGDTQLPLRMTGNRAYLQALHSVVDGQTVAVMPLDVEDETNISCPIPAHLTPNQHWVLEAHDPYGDLIAQWTPVRAHERVWTNQPTYYLDTKANLTLGYIGGQVQHVFIQVNQVTVTKVPTTALSQEPTTSWLTLYLQNIVKQPGDYVEVLALDAKQQVLDSLTIPVRYTGLTLSTAQHTENPTVVLIEGRLDLSAVSATHWTSPKTLAAWAQRMEVTEGAHTWPIQVRQMEQDQADSIYRFLLEVTVDASFTLPSRLRLTLSNHEQQPLMSTEHTVSTPIIQTLTPFTAQHDHFLSGTFHPAIRSRFAGKIILQLLVDGQRQGTSTYWDPTELTWTHYAFNQLTTSSQRADLEVSHNGQVLEIRPIPLYAAILKSISTVRLGQAQTLKVTLAKASESLTSLVLYRNGVYNSGGSGYTNSALHEVDVPFYVNASSFAFGDQLTMRVYASGRLIQEVPLQTEIALFQSAQYRIGESYVTGTYQQTTSPSLQLKQLALQIEDEPVLSRVPPLTSSTFQYYAKGKILSPETKVTLWGYNAEGQLLQKCPVNVILS